MNDGRHTVRPPVLVRLEPDTINRLAERVADLIAQRLDPPAPNGTHEGLLSASEVSAWWGVHRGWVYQHASELGAIPIGAGPRPRLRFDPEQVARYLERHPPSKPSPPPTSGHAGHGGDSRRSPRITRNPPRDLASGGHQSYGRSHANTGWPGGADTPPAVAPKRKPSAR